MPALYLMTYDLHRERNYSRVYELMGVYRAERLLESVWLGYLRGPAETILDHIRDALDGDDSATVIELRAGAEWSTIRAHIGGTDLLQRFIPSRF